MRSGLRNGERESMWNRLCDNVRKRMHNVIRVRHHERSRERKRNRLRNEIREVKQKRMRDYTGKRCGNGVRD